MLRPDLELSCAEPCPDFRGVGRGDGHKSGKWAPLKLQPGHRPPPKAPLPGPSLGSDCWSGALVALELPLTLSRLFLLLLPLSHSLTQTLSSRLLPLSGTPGPSP